ncbi:MAG: hypothetical protein KC503_07660 [Myxococcales bacterium]|nr:hypothetical protein [Myxococcales bacterium]
MRLSLAALVMFLLAPTVAAAQQSPYNAAAATSAAPRRRAVRRKVYDKNTGRTRTQVDYVKVRRDRYGNAQSSRYDLAVDGAFKGKTIVVLQFYTGGGFNFALPRRALATKGFSVYRWSNGAPSPKQLDAALKKACQLWVISGMTQHLNSKHLAVIKRFFNSGKGLYIWGDNAPYYGDANFIGKALFGATMHGNLIGSRVVKLQRRPQRAGIRPNHLLSTGLEHLFEGITIATIRSNQTLEPLLYGSANNLVVAYYDRGGKRAIFDGGFTRLYNKWDTAGTARYVKNAAAWLVNYERFGRRRGKKVAAAR